MSKYAAKREISLLNTNDLIEIFKYEFYRRLYEDKQELQLLELILKEIEHAKEKQSPVFKNNDEAIEYVKGFLNGQINYQ